MSKKKNRWPLGVLATALLGLPPATMAAGLGKLSVTSALGEPLRAEIDVTATREELSTLTARSASPDAFKLAGIEYAGVIGALRFSVDRRADGQPVLRLATDRPVNDPFVDLLVELNWAAGRLLREYTFLLDPPAAIQKAAPPVASPTIRQDSASANEAVTVKPVAPTVPVTTVSQSEPPGQDGKTGGAGPASSSSVGPVPQEPKPAPPGAIPRATAVAASAPPSGEPTEAGLTVRRGDTLGRLASENKPEGATLDQMLVALFASNRQAFAGDNMNRLKVGEILKLPAPDAVLQEDPAKAHKTVIAHAENFEVYRRGLAESVARAEAAKPEAAGQTVAGRLAAKVQENAKAPSVKDRLEISRAEENRANGAKATAAEAAKDSARDAARVADLAAHEKALRDANARVAELEKSVAELKRLLELRSQAGASLERQVESAKLAGPVNAPAPTAVAEPAKSDGPPAGPASLEPLVPGRSPDTPAAAKVADSDSPKSVEAPRSARTSPQPTTKTVAPPLPPEAGDDPDLALWGGGVLAAALAGLFGVRLLRRRQSWGATAPATFGGANDGGMVVGSSGTAEEHIADSHSDGLHTDSSPSTLGEGANEDVDVVAEADVYIAYGRAAQAEEILLRALKEEPTRHPVRLKLLEIYADRKALMPFEALARELCGQTGGAGAEWEKAAALGKALDPANALYLGDAKAAPAEHDFTATTAFLTALGSNPPSALEEPPIVLPPLTPPQSTQDTAIPFSSLDIGALPATESPMGVSSEAMSLNFDFDLELPSENPPVPGDGVFAVIADPPMGESSMPEAINTAIDTLVQPEQSPEHPIGAAAPAPLVVDWDLGDPAPPEPILAAPAFDLDLSLIEPAPGASSVDDLAMPGEAKADPENAEVDTKLDLAQAYEDMGDRDGARELLQEVLQEGNAAQQEAARQKLAALK